jgi:signal transduction histidine kinase
VRSRLTRRFVLFIATAAVAPLVVYGILSIGSLWEGTRESVKTGNLNVATRAADQIAQYITDSLNVLRALGADLRDTRLERWQQDRIVKNYVLAFPEFREIALFDADGTVVTSRVDQPTVSVPDASSVGPDGTSIAPITVDEDLLPRTTVAIRLTPAGEAPSWLVGELSLEELWRMVDSIRIGRQGYAMLLSRDGRLIAHGDPDEKRLIARGEGVVAPDLAEILKDARDPFREFRDRRNRMVLAAAAPIRSLGWTIIVEQPVDEAYAVAFGLERQLSIIIGVALLVTIVAGYIWGRGFLRRIFLLKRGTQAIAAGRMDERVAVPGRDEIHDLGEAFNTMADRLVELQDDLRRQERQAMFGRVASGLAHDLSTPIQNVGNSCKLIVRMWNDEEYRETFKRTVERELSIIKQMLDDLRNVARPMPLQRFPVDINRSVTEVVESMRTQADEAAVALRTDLAPMPLNIEGDPLALSRVYRNLISNAIQATAAGGRVAVSTSGAGERVIVRVADTGCGIPPERLGSIFDDFVTTKHRGLGLGLAITKRIVEQLGGSVTVTSEVGRGTTFVLDFPAVDVPALEAAAG